MPGGPWEEKAGDWQKDADESRNGDVNEKEGNGGEVSACGHGEQASRDVDNYESDKKSAKCGENRNMERENSVKHKNEDKSRFGEGEMGAWLKSGDYES